MLKVNFNSRVFLALAFTMHFRAIQMDAIQSRTIAHNVVYLTELQVFNWGYFLGCELCY